MSACHKTWFRLFSCSLGLLLCAGIAAVTYWPALAAENSAVLKDILGRINKQKSLIAQVQADYQADQQALAAKEQALVSALARRNPAEIKAATTARDAARAKADASYKKAKTAEEAECEPCKELESYLAGVGPRDLKQPLAEPSKPTPATPKTPTPEKIAGSSILKKPAVTPAKPPSELPEEPSDEEMVEEVIDEVASEEIVDEEMVEDSEVVEDAEMVEEEAEMVEDEPTESPSEESAPEESVPEDSAPEEAPGSDEPSVEEEGPSE